MRIEYLRMQAFGPYVSLQELDFAALGKYHLFLLRGPTGAGKTAILDAITYALYGKSSGGDRGDFEKMRSRLAAPKEKTLVELQFVLRGHRYRFLREIMIGHKRNGAELYKISVNGGEVVDDVFYPFFENCRQSALEKKAEELIGLNHAQFIQVMLLPQGKFEKLLISKSEEKQEILKTLFQTERWSQICDTLSEQLRQQKEKLDDQQRKIDVLLAGNEVKTLEELDELKIHKEEQLCELLKQSQQKKQEMETAARIYEEQVQTHQLNKRLAELKARQLVLQKQRNHRNRQKEQLSIQEERYRLQPYVNAYSAAQRNLQELEKREVAAQQEEQAIVQHLHTLQDQHIQITTARHTLEELRQRKNDLEGQESLWKEKAALDQQLNDIRQQSEKAQKQLQKRQKKMEQLKQEEAELLVRQETLEHLAATIPLLLKKVQLYQAQKQIFDRKTELSAMIQKTKEDISDKQGAYQEMIRQEIAAQRVHEQMYHAYLDHSAALLSQLLEEDKPCPVCGSLHHPHVAHAAEQYIELKELNAKKAVWESWTDQRHKQEIWLIQTEQRLHELEQDLQQIEDNESQSEEPEWNEVLFASVQEQLQKAQDAANKLVHCKEAVKSLIEMRKQSEADEKRDQEAHHQLLQALLIIETKRNERFASLPQDLTFAAFKKQYQDILEQIQKKEQFIQQWEAELKQYEMQYASCQTTITHLQEEQKEQIHNIEQAKNTLMQENTKQIPLSESVKELRELEREKAEIAQYEAEVQQMEAVISEVSIQVQEKQCFPIEEVKKHKTASEQQYQMILKEQLAIEQQVKRIAEVHASIQALRDSYEERMLNYAKQNEFVKAMRGDTSIGIERYVLGILLSNITQTANQLLKNVHGGRYQIYRSDEASGRTRKFGLELSVYDTYSCSMRSVVSLSGGEKFLVSLALSLALSTVVQARSGGVVIETMFIDEGFGSLDEQSIADALQILSTMANTKAMIGIISHVELLKENIPYGIAVKKNHSGSTCELLV